LAAFALALFVLVPRPPLKQGLTFSQAVYDDKGKLLRLTVSQDGKYRIWLPISKQSPLIAEATLLYEDRFFRWHPGVNPASLVRAAWQTYVAKGRRLGASTITMQLARIRYGIDSRSVSGKLHQILKALQIEMHYSKDEIIEAYLNLAPYGLNVEGAGAASLVYFGKRPSEISLYEALTLAVVPQDPAERMFGNQRELLDARRSLFNKWATRHPEARDQETFMSTLPVISRPADLPFKAPHFVFDVLSRLRSEPEIFTSIDSGLQDTLERVSRTYMGRSRKSGIRNMAVMLVDYRTMEIKALLGSADYFDDAIQGQVDGTSGLRSPGSTIKPFIYALAIDQGLLHPMSMLHDSPANFGAYSPENFDNKFIGPIKVKDALVRSRNVPAMNVAAMLGERGIYEFLQEAEVEPLMDKSFYGMAIAMGGIEISMRQMVELYSIFPNRGVLRHLNFLRQAPGQRPESGKRLLSPEASYITMQMLSENPPAGDAVPSQWKPGKSPVSWKTGTSFSFRDAWSIGIAGPYVLAVWVGNFDGSGNPAFVGREAAGPVFFEIVDALRAMGMVQVSDNQRLDIKEVGVCAVSGQMPNQHCPRTVKTSFIPGKSPIDKCTIHRRVLIDKRTGLRACSNTARGTKAEVYEFWPSDLLKIFRLAGIPRRTPPPYMPSCKDKDVYLADGIAPKIISPGRNVEFSTRASGSPSSEKVAFIAVTDADMTEVHWFLDERYLGRSESRTPFYWSPKPGRYVLRAVDFMGRSDSMELVVSVVN